MKFHVFAIFSREPSGQDFQNRFSAWEIIEVDNISKLAEKINHWIDMVLHEEPTSTKLLLLSHTHIPN